ncbi:tetratricopeptide repeat protein [Polyangium jinanense]|uniref:Tetratricopeptide repeat protein n=1 Tax=Polyangium jinanense TaxID=2829994 RepID=A0A9X3X2U9_9BACT|nr:hypothetical protein [Polyangium jinanense]MDC3952792.1 hypothetical protein [Polyangium jinanense]MDC3980411.1 hypothetical protein [Polyangium jinanense]
MPRAVALTALLWLPLLASIASAAEPDDAEIDRAVAALLKVGDKARAAGNVDIAVAAYNEALDLREDPEVEARLGMLAVRLGKDLAAAQNLLMALEGGAGATLKEKEELARAFAGVRSRVCQLLILGNVFDALVFVEGSPVDGPSVPGSTVFVKPGRTVVRGTSEAHGEVTETVDCPAGKRATANLRWKLPEPAPKVEPEPAPDVTPAIEVVPSTPPAPLSVTKAKADHALGIYIERDIPKQENPFAYEDPSMKPDKKPPMRGFVGLGPVVVFGAATWAPAVGASITGGLQLHEHVSLELEGRAAWLAGDVKGQPVSTMTAGGLLGLCGHWRWIYGCAVGHLGVITVNWDENTFKRDTDVGFRPGFGGRVGGRFDVGSSWGVQVAGDVLGLSRGTRIALGQTVLVEQPAIMIGTSLSAFWKF